MIGNHSPISVLIVIRPIALWFSCTTKCYSLLVKRDQERLCMLLRGHSFPGMTLEWPSAEDGGMDRLWDDLIGHMLMNVWFQLCSPVSHVYIIAVPPTDLCSRLEEEDRRKDLCQPHLWKTQTLSLDSLTAPGLYRNSSKEGLEIREREYNNWPKWITNSSLGSWHLAVLNKGGMDVAQPLSICHTLLCPSRSFALSSWVDTP